MKRKEKTSVILRVYNVISKAKYGKMDDADKIKLWKIARTIKPIATQFDEDSKSAAEKLQPTDDFQERLQKAQEFERMRNTNEDMSNSPMGAAEYNKFIGEFQKYNKLVNDAVKEFADKEVEVDIECISEDAFSKLIASNSDWTVEQTIEVGAFILE
jgi:hypothetical protein